MPVADAVRLILGAAEALELGTRIEVEAKPIEELCSVVTLETSVDELEDKQLEELVDPPTTLDVDGFPGD
jgi:hypothetical protein